MFINKFKSKNTKSKNTKSKNIKSCPARTTHCRKPRTVVIPESELIPIPEPDPDYYTDYDPDYYTDYNSDSDLDSDPDLDRYYDHRTEWEKWEDRVYERQTQREIDRYNLIYGY
jgi:hypothetical protein